jgi:cellobiose phosphorylase
VDTYPWINVIANPSFGFQVSESGAGYTWSMAARTNLRRSPMTR